MAIDGALLEASKQSHAIHGCYKHAPGDRECYHSYPLLDGINLSTVTFSCLQLVVGTSPAVFAFVSYRSFRRLGPATHTSEEE